MVTFTLWCLSWSMPFGFSSTGNEGVGVDDVKSSSTLDWSWMGNSSSTPDDVMVAAACITICPTRALDLIDHLAVVEMPKCTLCGLCPASCPVHAITLED